VKVIKSIVKMHITYLLFDLYLC